MKDKPKRKIKNSWVDPTKTIRGRLMLNRLNCINDKRFTKVYLNRYVEKLSSLKILGYAPKSRYKGKEVFDFGTCTPVYAELSHEEFLRVEHLIEKLTGEYWPPDKIIKLLFNWFAIEFGENPRVMTKKGPFFIPKRRVGRSNRKVELLKERMGKYFKNIPEIE